MNDKDDHNHERNHNNPTMGVESMFLHGMDILGLVRLK